MTRLMYSLAVVVGLAAAGTPTYAQQSGNVRVEFQGPGGHSSGAYGRVSALHAAARAVILIQKALPAGSYQITNLTGGNSVTASTGVSGETCSRRASRAWPLCNSCRNRTSSVSRLLTSSSARR